MRLGYAFIAAKQITTAGGHKAYVVGDRFNPTRLPAKGIPLLLVLAIHWEPKDQGQRHQITAEFLNQNGHGLGSMEIEGGAPDIVPPDKLVPASFDIPFPNYISFDVGIYEIRISVPSSRPFSLFFEIGEGKATAFQA